MTEFLAYVRSGAGANGDPQADSDLDARIGAILTAASPLRRIANVVAGAANKVVDSDAWLTEIAPPYGELYAAPAASQAMLDDTAFDVEAWLASEIATEFARAETPAFVAGNGVNKPEGFLRCPASPEADGERVFGTVQYIETGVSGGFPAVSSHDKLIDLVQSLRAPYRQGAVFVMNSATAARCRKFRTDSAFIWQPGLSGGQPDTLLGYPVIEVEDMPDIAPDAFAIAFGNFRAGYLIAERSQTHILRDPYSNKPFVHFYATKRVGGRVMNSEAIKLLRFSG